MNIHGEKISMLRFADDIAVTAETEKDLKNILVNMGRVMGKYQLKINTKKTKILVCSRREEVKTNIKIGKQKLVEVDEFCYLGSRITSDGRSKKEIISRIAQAKVSIRPKERPANCGKLKYGSKETIHKNLHSKYIPVLK